MDNVRPEGTEDQFVTSPSGEALGWNVCVSVLNALEDLHKGTTKDLGLLESVRMMMLQV